MQLAEQVALVTGAGQGIGRAAAVSLAAAGADIVAVDINGVAVKETAGSVAAQGRKSLAIEADMGRVSDIDRMAAEAMASSVRSTSSSTMPASPAAPISWTSPRQTGIASTASTPRACFSACSGWRAR